MQSTQPIPGYEGLYSATAFGQIISHRAGRPLKPYLTPGGYPMVALYGGGTEKRICVHRLVALTFHGEPEGRVVRHLDGNRLNNHARNLRYGTPAENAADSILHGTNSNLRKTACKRGHEFDEQNTAIRSNGSRTCRRCRADRMNALYANNPEHRARVIARAAAHKRRRASETSESEQG